MLRRFTEAGGDCDDVGSTNHAGGHGAVPVGDPSSTAVGMLTADWGFWKRYINLPKIKGEWAGVRSTVPEVGIDGP